MVKARAITAGAIVLTLALGGANLWTSPYVNAATASVDKQLEQGTQTDKGAAKKDHSGKRGGFGSGFEHIQEQLTAYLGLDKAALQTKLETLTLSEVAVEQGKTRAELKEKLVEWLEAAAAQVKAEDKPAVAEKRLTADDAAATAEKLLDATKIGLGKHGGGERGAIGLDRDALASALGMTADELKADQEAGKTIAAIAEDKGIAVQTLIDLQTKEKEAKLAEQLTAATITQEQYDTRLADITERATKYVNGEFTGLDKGDHKNGRGGKGPRGERPDGAGAKDKSATDEAAAKE